MQVASHLEPLIIARKQPFFNIEAGLWGQMVARVKEEEVTDQWSKTLEEPKVSASLEQSEF